jgi:hypothetical protein
MKWTAGASVAAATVVVLLLGGIFRDSSAATTSPIVEPVVATEQFQAGFSAGGQQHCGSREQAPGRAATQPERREVPRRTRPRIPAAGA